MVSNSQLQYTQLASFHFWISSASPVNSAGSGGGAVDSEKGLSLTASSGVVGMNENIVGRGIGGGGACAGTPPPLMFAIALK